MAPLALRRVAARELRSCSELLGLLLRICVERREVLRSVVVRGGLSWVWHQCGLHLLLLRQRLGAGLVLGLRLGVVGVGLGSLGSHCGVLGFCAVVVGMVGHFELY